MGALYRPELAAISAQEESLEQAVRSERAQGLPQIALHARFHWCSIS